MAGSVLRQTFSRGVGKRIFGFFLLASVVPMLFTAGLAYYEIARNAEKEASRELRNSAKAYGVDILTRLQLVGGHAREVVRIVEQGRSFEDHQYLLDDFEAIWSEERDGSVSLVRGADGINAPEPYGETLDVGEERLVFSDGPSLIMYQAVSDGSVMAFELNGWKIWGPRENLPFNTEFCVFTETGVGLYCTADINPGIHASLLADANARSSVFSSWEQDGVTRFAALWQLFLGASFATQPMDIIAIQDKEFALASGTDFRRVFFPAIALVLVLVGVLSLNLVGRSLVPLQHLTLAARQIASGNLRSRVRVRTGDEFEWLAEAFNNMASRLGRQISTLEAMSGIDRMILSGTRFEDVSEDVVKHLVALTHCSAAAVIARDIHSANKAKMISLHKGEFTHERISLPHDMGNQWCQPRQVSVGEVDARVAPYKERFEAYEQNYVVVIPVIMQEDIKGILLLGFKSRFDMTRNSFQRCVDLAGRFAVALTSVEREESLYRQAHFDPLTALPNRQLLKERLEQQLVAARIENHSGAILYLDLDRFKEINDVFGHSVGDVVLEQAAERIISEVRGRDTVARLGGDEFVIILPSIRNHEIVRATADRLLNKLGDAFTVNDVDHYLSASIGIVIFPEDGDSVELLLKNADAAMYRAKDAGRNRYEFFSEQLNDESRRKISLERDLRAAFYSRKLELCYQPQFDVYSGDISGAEALLRWEHPEEGSVSPDEFIPMAEESGLIIELGAWVIEQACRDLCEVIDRGYHPGPMSINVSARQLRESSFVEQVMEPIRRFGIHPGYLQLEVTETTVAQNRDTAIRILETLRAEGVRIAIDDFGTGYSSLSYLQQMPFDVIKIDKSFIQQIGTGTTSDNICRTIIKMAEELGKKSIAEGVENDQQVAFLKKHGCNSIQGFFYSGALPQADFVGFVGKQDFHTQRRKALEIL